MAEQGQCADDSPRRVRWPVRPLRIRGVWASFQLDSGWATDKDRHRRRRKDANFRGIDSTLPGHSINAPEYWIKRTSYCTLDIELWLWSCSTKSGLTYSTIQHWAQNYDFLLCSKNSWWYSSSFWKHVSRICNPFPSEQEWYTGRVGLHYAWAHDRH